MGGLGDFQITLARKNSTQYHPYPLVIATGLEPVTVCLEGRCSIHLSYATLFRAKIAISASSKA